jgi:integrase
MATVNFRLRSNANKNVNISIYLSLGRGNLISYNTGFTINPKDWSTSTNKPKQNNDVNKLLFNNLTKLQSFVYDNLNDSLSKGVIIDKHWLESQIKECFKRVEKVDNGLLINHIQYIIDNANTRTVKGKKGLGISKNRIKSYETFKTTISEYQKVIKKSIHLLDINKPFVDTFINWLFNTQGYSVNYSGKIIANLKTVCNDANSLGIKTNPYYTKIESFKDNNDDRYIVILSNKELEQIRETEIENPALNNAKKWILIGCHLGQRGGDLLKLTSDNIRFKNNLMYIDITQEKTGKFVTIPIVEQYIEDIITNDMPYTIKNQKLNLHIKKVCEIAKINEVIEGKKIIVTKTGKRVINKKGKTVDEIIRRTVFGHYPKHELVCTHSFRRSFATNYYKKIPTPVLITMTGHSKESAFLDYINQREDKDANADLFRDLYERMKTNEKPQLKLVRNGN